MRDIGARLHRGLGEKIEVRMALAPESWTVDADAGERAASRTGLAAGPFMRITVAGTGTAMAPEIRRGTGLGAAPGCACSCRRPKHPARPDDRGRRASPGDPGGRKAGRPGGVSAAG
jgi:hypothetical protein